MPRGQRKSLEEKIQAKQELINALNIRIESCQLLQCLLKCFLLVWRQI